MKGIILAGGYGSRLYPMTLAFSKQLLPVYDKPMVYYPLSILMFSGIRDILLITTPADLPLYKSLLGNGKQWGISIVYKEQLRPDGLAQAFILGEEFLENGPACLILGDNIFYGQGLQNILQESAKQAENDGAVIFGYRVSDPERYGIVGFDQDYMVTSIEEKPLNPKSNYAVTGLYFYDSEVCRLAKKVELSARGELEITSLNNFYLEQGNLCCKLLGRGMVWLDTGTPESLTEAGSYFRTIEARQGLKISCLEEIAVYMGYVEREVMLASIKKYKSGYYDYVRVRLLEM